MSGPARKARGRRTELLLTEKFREVFPHAEQVGAGAPGVDIKNTPGFAVEVKARTGLDLGAWMRQAAKNAKPGEIPTLCVRLNGQGEETVDDWPVVLRTADFLDTVGLLRQAVGHIYSVQEKVFEMGTCPYSWEPVADCVAGPCDCGREQA